MNKTFKVLEIIWLVMSGVGIFMSVYSIFIKDYKNALYFLAFFIICGGMFAVRRHQRLKSEEEQKRQEQNK